MKMMHGLQTRMLVLACLAGLLSGCITKRTVTQNGRPVSSEYVVKPPTVRGTLNAVGTLHRVGN